MAYRHYPACWAPTFPIKRAATVSEPSTSPAEAPRDAGGAGPNTTSALLSRVKFGIVANAFEECPCRRFPFRPGSNGTACVRADRRIGDDAVGGTRARRIVQFGRVSLMISTSLSRDRCGPPRYWDLLAKPAGAARRVSGPAARSLDLRVLLPRRREYRLAGVVRYCRAGSRRQRPIWMPICPLAVARAVKTSLRRVGPGLHRALEFRAFE